MSIVSTCFTCSVCRNHNRVLSSSMTYHRVCDKSNATGVTCGAGTAHPRYLRYLSYWGWCCSVMSNYMSSRFHFRVGMSVSISAEKRCSIRLDSHFLCRVFMFSLCNLYIFTYTGVHQDFNFR